RSGGRRLPAGNGERNRTRLFCGLRNPMRTLRVLIVSLSICSLLPACGDDDDQRMPAPAIKNLFVGNSYTFARVAPALQSHAANVKDLTAGFNAIDPTGTNSF